ncbi:MAG TPA: UPF0158 family protein [Candidatus Eremiobacteraceae bacterium]|nr:UPF0158 family protein [Candidatus Eremiobacteraceae bacterium]
MKETSTDSAHVTAEWIRRPLPDLGGIPPVDAVNEPEARRKLDDLLTELAGHHVRLANLGLPAIDPAEIRKALGIEAVAATPARAPARVVRPGPIKRNQLLDELGTALTGGDVDSVAYYNTKSHAVEHFMHNLGDQENARIAEADANADMKKIAPVTTEVRYGIMSDFISLVEDINVAGRLRSAISGKGAFRRFREAVDEDDTLRRRWLGYRTKRHYHLALDWLHVNGYKPEGLNPADYDWEPQSEASRAAETTRAASAKPAPSAENASATPSPAASPVAQEPEQAAPTHAAEAATETQAAQQPDEPSAMEKPEEEVTASTS